MPTDKERLAVLEANVVFIKDTLVGLDKKVDDLQSFKFKMVGVSGVISLLITIVCGWLGINR